MDFAPQSLRPSGGLVYVRISGLCHKIFIATM